MVQGRGESIRPGARAERVMGHRNAPLRGTWDFCGGRGWWKHVKAGWIKGKQVSHAGEKAS